MVEVSRRRMVEASGAAAVAGVSGCLDRAQAVLERNRGNPVTLTISSLPADDDERSTAIAQFLAEGLRQVGVKATVRLSPPTELFRTVLINQDFDLYVARSPEVNDPDVIRPLLHSRFVEQVGWQNPFGFANPSVDELLERQRRVGSNTRPAVVADLQRQIARYQPFTAVAIPDVIRAVRRDRLTIDTAGGFDSPLGYLWVSVVEDDDGAGPRELRLTRTDARVTESLNPLAAEFRTNGRLIGLLYDSLGRRVAGRVWPWLAEDWSIDRTPESGLVATVRLRGDATWHDGRPMTSEDVAFTYRFLQDTSLGRLDSAVPAPRFHGRVSLVRSVDVVDRHTIKLRLEPANRPVVERALTVPILPEHVWEGLTGPATVAGIEVAPQLTEALVWENSDPVGSGPMRIARRIPETELVLERTGNHAIDAGAIPWFDGEAGYDRLVIRIVPSASAAVELVAVGEADATDTPVGPETAPQIGRADGVGLEVSESRSFYHVGFNARRPPLSNYQFRRAVARLLDKAFLVDEVFDGYARPVASPLAKRDDLPSELEWSGEDPVLPFPGSDGVINESRGRGIFEEAGYRYDETGTLLERS